MADSIIGIDIGNYYTKVVEISQKAMPGLLNAFMFKSPFLASAQDPSLRQIDTASFWKQISKHIPLSRCSKSQIGISLPAEAIATLLLLLPKMSRSELAQAAIVEAKRKMIPASGPGHAFEWLFLGEKITAKIPRCEILVARAEKSYIQQMIDLLKNISATPTFINPPCFSLANLIINGADDKEAVVFIDLGSGNLNISACKAKRLVFMRNLAFGLADIAEDLSHKLGIPMEMTEEIIKERGIPDVDFDLNDKVRVAEEIMRQKYEAQAAGQKNEVNLLELRMLWESHLERIIHELRRSFLYYKEQGGDKRLEYIYFFGGGCLIKNLVGLLVKQLGGSCQVISPFKNMQILKTQTPEELTIAPVFANAASLGLAILAKGKKEDTINFLPAELKRREAAASRRLAMLIAALCLVAVFVLTDINLLINGYSLQVSLKQTALEFSKIKNPSDKLKELDQLESRVRQRSTQIEALVKQGQDFSLPLKELARAVPGEILITKIDIYKSQAEAAAAASDSAPMGLAAAPPAAATTAQTKYRISLAARIFTDYEEALKIIARFKASLESLPYFTNIEVVPLKLEKVSLEEAARTVQALRLTQPKERNFTLTADVAKQ